ncbi:MAG: sugar phosphate isomerase/epimerase [Anaerolineales bacterium]|nr:MAG: sugar phosphate isomerase/epimerase [Anaerolineales bacterium]
MILSCSTLCCTLDAYPHIEETLAKIKALGFHTIDLAAFENWQNINPSVLAQPGETWSSEFLRGIEATGLKVSSFNCGLSIPLNNPQRQDYPQIEREFRALVKMADAVGCPNITVQPGNPVEGTALETLLAITAENVRALAPISQERGITLSLEGHQGSILEDPDVAYHFMESLWPEVGFTYDPSHWTMQDIPLPVTEPLLDVIYHVHARNATTDKMQETMAQGKVDFAWLVRALEKHGYSGAVSLEYFSGFDRDFSETLALRDVLVSLGVG